MSKYPITSQGVEYNEEECHPDFKSVYQKRSDINKDGSIFLYNNFYIYPNGKIKNIQWRKKIY
mgnify:CR=1 FL=1